MRLYAKKFIGNKIRDYSNSRTETRDAVLWDIDYTARTCRVKIQGSNEHVTAHFPSNWERTPAWLKPGNAVRIIHLGGNRGRIEVAGHGQVVPTPVAGGAAPTPPTPSDGIIAGGSVNALPVPTMQMTVSAIEYRIDGETYESGATTVTISSAPPVGSYRYDKIVVGIDGVVDYIQGSNGSPPTMPATPTDHIAIDWILISPSLTYISQDKVHKVWTTPAPTYLTLTFSDSALDWDELTSEATITVKDQYGQNITSDDPGGWYGTLEITAGNGTLTSSEEGEGTLVGLHFGASASGTFTYTRDQLPGDSSPILEALIPATGASTIGQILLYDQYDSLMGGTVTYTSTYLPGGETLESFDANITIDWRDGATVYLELTASCTITFTNTLDGDVYRLILMQKNGGSHYATLSDVDYWQGGTTPTFTTTENHSDVVTFLRSNDKVWAAATLDFY